MDSINVTDVANLTQYTHNDHQACIDLEPGSYLEHGREYFVTVWAYNRGHKQLAVAKISDGGKLHYRIYPTISLGGQCLILDQ